MENTTILSETKAANLLGVSASTLASLRKKGLGPRYTRYPSSAIRYKLNDLTSFIKECTCDGYLEKQND